MHALFSILHASHTTHIHHKLALDGLQHITAPQAALWQRLFLRHYPRYLTGALAPDRLFCDYKNHVLHPKENNWGGALMTAQSWYERLSGELESGRFAAAVYSAGVLSHYVTDSLHPLHTAHSETGNSIMAGFDHAINRHYDLLMRRAAKAFPDMDIVLPDGPDWLRQALAAGARLANTHYASLVRQFDLQAVARHDHTGLDEELTLIAAFLLNYARRLFSHILSRALTEARVQPPHSRLPFATLRASLSAPLHRPRRLLEMRRSRRMVKAQYAEFTQTGTVDRTLGDPVKTVRDLHKQEVMLPALQQITSLAGPQTRIASTRPCFTDRRQMLERQPLTPQLTPPPAHISEQTTSAVPFEDRPVMAAASIGPKTARRLKNCNILTIFELLHADPARLAACLDVEYITPDTISSWQRQIRLQGDAPGLLPRAIRLLDGAFGAGLTHLLGRPEAQLIQRLKRYCASPAGQKQFGRDEPPDSAELRDWLRQLTRQRRGGDQIRRNDRTRRIAPAPLPDHDNKKLAA